MKANRVEGSKQGGRSKTDIVEEANRGKERNKKRKKREKKQTSQFKHANTKERDSKREQKAGRDRERNNPLHKVDAALW